MHMLLMLGLVGLAAVGASYAVGQVSARMPNAGDIPTYAVVGLGLAAAVFAPWWLALVGVGAAVGTAVRWAGQAQIPQVKTQGQLSGDRGLPAPPGYRAKPA